jgi:hypothetical protein
MLGFNLKGSIPAGLAGKGAEVGFSAMEKDRVEGCGIPHLAKNERDVGHPGLVLTVGKEPQIILLRSRKTFPRRSVHTEISPLRYAPVPRHAYGDQGAVEKPKVVTLW